MSPGGAWFSQGEQGKIAARAWTQRHEGVLATVHLSLPNRHGCNLCKTLVNQGQACDGYNLVSVIVYTTDLPLSVLC